MINALRTLLFGIAALLIVPVMAFFMVLFLILCLIAGVHPVELEKQYKKDKE